MKLMRISNALLIVAFCGSSAVAQTAAFSYQGRLTESGNPVTGSRFFRFTLYDENGVEIPGANVEQTLTVTNAVFNTSLNFGAGVFSGANRTLEIAVKINIGDPFTVLNPRQPIVSSPYSIRTLSASQADTSLDSARLGGIVASEYVTTSSVGGAFIQNTQTQQTADFSISGSGTLGGALTANTVTAQTATGLYGLLHTDGTTTVGTYIGGSTSGAVGGWVGTVTNDPLHLFTNNGQPQLTVLQNGNVGIGTFDPQAKLHVAGNAAQDRDKSGMVKAMLYVDGNVFPPSILRCYNGITGASTENCGFTINRTSAGFYEVNFGFQVSDRFISIAVQNDPPPIIGGPRNVEANFRFPAGNNAQIVINTFYTGASQNEQDAAFILIVY